MHTTLKPLYNILFETCILDEDYTVDNMLEELYFEGPNLESWTVLVEQNVGEGLALFVWEDLDGDEVHCGLNKDEERSRLIVLDENSLELQISVELSVEFSIVLAGRKRNARLALL